MKFNDKFFTDLLVSPGVERVVMEATERVAERARATAAEDTGDFKNSITVSKKRQKRIVGVVTAEDPAALAIEAKHGTLARAVRSAGRGA